MLTSGYFRIMTMSLRPWLTRHWLWRRRSLRVSGLRSNVGVSDHGAATARPRVYLVTAGARAGGLMADSNRWLMDSFDRSKHISMNHIFKYITTHMLNIIQVTIHPKSPHHSYTIPNKVCKSISLLEILSILVVSLDNDTIYTMQWCDSLNPTSHVRSSLYLIKIMCKYLKWVLRKLKVLRDHLCWLVSPDTGPWDQDTLRRRDTLELESRRLTLEPHFNMKEVWEHNIINCHKCTYKMYLYIKCYPIKCNLCEESAKWCNSNVFIDCYSCALTV